MKNYIFTFSMLCILACNNTSDNGHADHAHNAAIPKTASDSLYKAVMAGHDRGMAKMGELNRYKNLAKQKQDSIAKLKTKPAAQSAALDSIVSRLNEAEKLMNKWMDEFDPNKAGETEQEKTAYYSTEKQKVDTVEARINSSIENAQARMD